LRAAIPQGNSLLISKRLDLRTQVATRGCRQSGGNSCGRCMACGSQLPFLHGVWVGIGVIAPCGCHGHARCVACGVTAMVTAPRIGHACCFCAVCHLCGLPSLSPSLCGMWCCRCRHHRCAMWRCGRGGHHHATWCQCCSCGHCRHVVTGLQKRKKLVEKRRKKTY
jgi:hypothetical protein